MNFPKFTLRLLMKFAGSAGVALCLLAFWTLATRSLGAPNTSTVEWSDGHQSFKFVLRGDVHFTEDDTDIKSLSPDGSLTIERNNEKGRFRFEARPSKDQGIERVYSVDGKVQPWDTVGRKWLAQQLPDLIRESAIDAAQRIARIRRNKGEAAVLDYISLTHSDGAKRVYFQELFAAEPLTVETKRRAIRQIADEIQSDGDKAAVLKDLATHYLRVDDLRPSFFAAEQSIHSDGDQSSVLGYVLKEDDEAANVKCVIESAATISSDGDKSSVMVKAIGFSARNEPLQIACLESADTIHSDGDHERVLAALLRNDIASDKVFCRAFSSAARISSDGDKSHFLCAAAGKAPTGQPVFESFLDAARTIHSDGDKAHVLINWIKREEQPEGALARIRTVAEEEIHSEGDRRQVEKLVQQRQDSR